MKPYSLTTATNLLQSSYAFHKDLLDNDKIGKDENDKICPKGYRP